MTYTTDTNKERGAPIRRSISWGTKLILGVFGIGLFKTELQRILSLPRTLNTDLYLVLLIATILLTAGWIFVANKEFDIICDFLDPEDYSVPDETVTSLAVASILTILLYASRNPLWFGISYSIYCALSVYAWIHMKNEMQRAVMGSRRRLEKEPLTGAPFISDALDALYSYYVTQPNVPRLLSIA